MLLVCCCIQEVHQQNPNNPQETIRARIYKKTQTYLIDRLYRRAS